MARPPMPLNASWHARLAPIVQALGPPAAWPEGMWGACSLCLASPAPMLVMWRVEDQLINLCNDLFPHQQELSSLPVLRPAALEVLRSGQPLPVDCTPPLRCNPIPLPDGAVGGVVFGLAPELPTSDGLTASATERQTVDILESMSDAFFSVDKDWRMTRVNARHEAVTQIPRGQQLGRNLFDLFFSVPNARHLRYMEAYYKAMNERVHVAFEEYYPPLDLWTAVRVYPTPDGGLAIFFTDISTQKKAAERVAAEKHKMEAVFVDSPAPMALLRGPELVFEMVNDQYTALLAGRDLVGKPLLEAVPELVGQPFHALMLKVLRTGAPYGANEMVARLIRHPGGEPEDTYVDFTYTRVTDGQGQPYGVYIHATDVTDKVLARRKVERLAEDLRGAIRVRDEFLSIASHELKTPVTSLSMQLQMTRRQVRPDQDLAPPPAKLAKSLDLSIRQVGRLTALMEDLLDVARVESGKMTYTFEPVDVAALALEVVERFEEQLHAARCSLDVSECEAVQIDCDRYRIEQVVTNLLTNAIKYGAQSPIRLRVQRTTRGAAITVADGGIGIAKEKQSLVFGRFERAVSHRSISGLGLGLYITKQIVDAHGGDVTLQSEEGQGATFTVLLPFAPPDPPAS